MGKLTKKATSKIIDLVQAIDHSMGKNISFDEAWEIISEYVGIEGDIYTTNSGVTKFTLYKGEDIVGTLEWNNDDVFMLDQGDWNWTKIFNDVIEYMMKNKLVKKPRSKSREHISTSNKNYNIKTSDTPQTPSTSMDIDELKRKKSSLYQKIREWGKKGKDVTELKVEYDNICAQIKAK